MRQRKRVLGPALDLAVVGEQRLERLVDLDGLPCEPDVEGGEAAEVFELAETAGGVEVFLFRIATLFPIFLRIPILPTTIHLLILILLIPPKIQILQHNPLLRHQLQHLERETQERRRLPRDARCAANELEVCGAVAQRRGIEAETLLFPVVRLGDALAHTLFEEQRGVLAFDEGAAVASVVEEGGGVGAIVAGFGGRGHCGGV